MRSRVLPLCLLCLSVVACGKKVKVSETYEAREDQPNPEYSYGSNVEFESPDDAKLGEAKAAIRNQDYPTATRTLQRLYEDASTKREVREEALYLLGEVQSALLNPERNNAAAIATFERLLQEFPRSKFALKAEDALAELRPPGADTPDDP